MIHRPKLKEVMQKYDLLPQKSLGQNFLLDENITHKIAASAGNLKGHHIIEIGPGPGGLTRAILDLGADKVTAIEKDPRCIAALVDLNDDRLEILNSDALKYDFERLFQSSPLPVKIIANLPYNVGTELLFKWLPLAQHIRSMTLMFQKEVVDRIIASPNTKHYGRLSVMVQWLASAKRKFDLPPSVFTPPPKVTSSVVHIEPKVDAQIVPYSSMEYIVKLAFSHRRKMLKACFKPLSKDILLAAKIDPSQRGESLSIHDFETLVNAFCSYD